jgi:L-lactate dehydrogenase complex protein LldG
MAVEPATAVTSLWSTFTAKAELLGAAVMRTSSQATAVTLLAEAAAGYACTAHIAKRYPAIEAAAQQAGGVPAKEVVTAAEFAVAETGSVAINEPAPDRGRCFLAERLWVLVAEDALVPTLDAAMQRMGELIRAGAVHPLLMSGPSRTADIERVLTIGVHGPRALAIVVVGSVD